MEELKKLINEINDDDLKKMFGTAYSATILNEDLEKIKEKLDTYLEYDVPVRLGNIVEFNGETYVVTCVYTDNSVDLLSKDATKKNVGLYMETVKVTGKLDVIKED